jgi:uncharacterized protein YukE
MDEVAVDCAALDVFSDRTVGRRDEFDQIRHRMDGVRLPRDAFGYIPGIGGKIHDSYEEFVDLCADAAAQITEAIYSLSQGVREASEAYAESDAGSAARLDATGVPHPGVK